MNRDADNTKCYNKFTEPITTYASHPRRRRRGPLWYYLVVDGPADQVHSTGTSSLIFPTS